VCLFQKVTVYARYIAQRLNNTYKVLGWGRVRAFKYEYTHCNALGYWLKGKRKDMDIFYSDAYTSQTRDQVRFTISGMAWMS